MLAPKTRQYRRSLGLFELVSLGVGGTIGSGIFVVPGTAAAVAGTYSLIAWGIVAFSAACVAISIAGLFTRGGERLTFHSLFTEVFGNRIADGLILLYLVSSVFGIATIAAGIGQYLGYFGEYPILAIEIGILAVFCFLNLIGIYISGMTENVLTVLKILPLLVITAVLVFFIQPANFVSSTAFTGHALLSAIIIVYWPFTGFEISAIPSEETRDPRMISRSLVYVMVIVSIVYLLLNVALIGSVGADLLAFSPAPLAAAAEIFLPNAGIVVAIIGIIAMLSALNAYLIGSSRVLQQVSETYRIFRLRDVSTRGVPAIALVLISTVTAVTLMYSNHFSVLASLSVITNLVPYISFCTAAFLSFSDPYRRIIAGFGIGLTSSILLFYFLL